MYSSNQPLYIEGNVWARFNRRPVKCLLSFIIVCSCFHSDKASLPSIGYECLKAWCSVWWFNSKTLWNEVLWFFFLLLCLPRSTLANVSFAKIQYWHLRLPAVCLCAYVCVFELLWGHPVWVFLLQCSFRLRNSSFSVDGAYGLAHSASLPLLTRPHMQTQEQTRFRLCCIGQVTEGVLFENYCVHK